MDDNSSVLSDIKKENHAVLTATWNVVDYNNNYTNVQQSILTRLLIIVFFCQILYKRVCSIPRGLQPGTGRHSFPAITNACLRRLLYTTWEADLL